MHSAVASLTACPDAVAVFAFRRVFLAAPDREFRLFYIVNHLLAGLAVVLASPKFSVAPVAFRHIA